MFGCHVSAPCRARHQILNDADMTQGLLLFRGAFYTGDG